MSFAQNIQGGFSLKTFFIGFLGVAGIYASLFAYVFFVQDETLRNLEARLATQTVLIDRNYSSTSASTSSQSQKKDVIQETSSGYPSSKPEEATGDEHLSPEDLVSREAKSLRKSPVPGFFEKTEYGLLPIAKSPMQTPFEIYKKPFTFNSSKPHIAVAVQEFGLSKPLSEKMIAELPSSVSLILSPYSANPEEWSQKARKKGHEVWLHIPVENNRFPMDDPGAKGLLTRVSLQYNQERLAWLLGRATGYAGIAAFTDSALDNSGTMFKNMVRDTFGRGLGYFELNAASSSNIFKEIAQNMQTPYTQAASPELSIIDPEHEDLQGVQTKIETDGGAIILLSPSPNNIPALKAWLEELEQQGVTSTPVSAIAAPDIERN